MGGFIRAILFGGAAVIAYYSFETNAAFWRATFAADPERMQFFVAISYCAGALKYGLAMYSEFFGVKLRKAPPLLLLFVIALAFDLTSGLGYAQASRNEISKVESANAARRVELGRQISEAEAARDRIGPTRTKSRIESELSTESAKGGCEEKRDARTDRCAAVGKLKAELADADARGKIETKLEGLRADIAAVPPAKDADPQAAAVAGALNPVLRFAGLELSAAGAGFGLSMLLVLLLEFGPATAFRAAVAKRDPVPVKPAPEAPRERPKIFIADTCAPANDEIAAAQPKRARRVTSPGHGVDLLDVFNRAALEPSKAPGWLQVAPDGWIYFNLAGAAKACSVTKPTIARRLDRFSLEGLAEVRTSKDGTAIKLLHPLKSAA